MKWNVACARAFAVLLPSVLLASFLFAQEHGGEYVNWGRTWNSWSSQMRTAYLSGFVDGQSGTYLAIYRSLSPEASEGLRERTAVLYDSDVLSAVMTDLYRDPANAFIRAGAMVYLARDKLSGQDIDAALRHARQNEQDWIPRWKQ